MYEQATSQSDKRTSPSEGSVRVTSKVLAGVGKPAIIVPATEAQPSGKASRPLKGRFAHVPYSSEDLIKEKKKEAELEDRSS